MRFLFTAFLIISLAGLAACASSTPTPPPPQPTAAPAVQKPTQPPAAGMVTSTPEPPPTQTPQGGEIPTMVALNAPTNTPPAQTPIPVAPVPTDSPYVGVFSGILPAADAIARVVTLDLAVDGTANMTTQFIGKGAPIIESGTWTEIKDLANVVLSVEGSAPQDNRLTWRLEDNKLTTVLFDKEQYGEGMTLQRVGTGIKNQAEYQGVTFSFDTSLAKTAQGSTQPAVPADQNAPALGGGAPENIRFLFDNAQTQDYFDPHLPQVYVYPVAGLKALDPSVAKNVDDLQKIINDKAVPEGQKIPIFPVMPANQVLHAQTRFFDFVNGSGVSFITYYSQAANPISSADIFYTFQGITLDGEWYVAVYWNVATPALPDNAQAASQALPANVTAEQYEKYLADIVTVLNSLPPAAFVPNLTLLDNMVQSINAAPTLNASAPTPAPTVASNSAAPQNAQMLSAAYNGSSFNFSSALAQSAQGFTIPAVPVDTNAPGLGGGAPENTAFGFNGEKITADVSPFQPAVRVYPTAGIQALDPMVAKQVDELKTLLSAKPATVEQNIPVFPIFNAAQVMHPQVKYMNFKNGQGVRFVTYYAQDVSPLTNDGLFYTFQGLTNDGKYYVTVFWNLRTDALPNSYQDAKIQDYNAFAKQYEQYLKDTVNKMNGLPPEAFTPNLTLLDEMAESVSTPQ